MMYFYFRGAAMEVRQRRGTEIMASGREEAERETQDGANSNNILNDLFPPLRVLFLLFTALR